MATPVSSASSTLNDGDDRGLPGEVYSSSAGKLFSWSWGGSVASCPLSDSGGSIVEGVTVEPGHGTSKDMDS